MALSRLPVIGLTRYNGYTFPNASVETIGYDINALYDSSRRTVWACEFIIALRWTIEGANSTSTDSQAESITEMLMRPGGVLEYDGRGFGTPGVNVGRVTDVDWGPRPQSIRFQPSGAGRATEVTWTVRFTLPTCDDAVYTGVREFCFSIDYNRDRSGYSTRTYHATVKIAQTRKNVRDRTLRETADDYLEKIIPGKVPGFRRESVNRSISEDKCALTVTVVDVQMPPQIPPYGIIDASVEHSYNSQPGTHGLKWNGSFNASYEIARQDGSVRGAVEDFLGLARDRISLAATMKFAAGPEGGLAGGLLGAIGAGPVVGGAIGDKSIIPITFSITEPNVYGRTEAKFGLTYFIGGVPLMEILRAGGLWKPWGGEPTKAWRGWVDSLPRTLSPRGHADLHFRPNDDKIVDLCAAVPPQVPQETSLRANRPGNAIGGIGRALRARLLEVFPTPTPAGSWLAYKNYVTLTADTGRVVGSTLPSEPLSTSRTQSPVWDVYGNMPSATGGNSPFPPLAGLLTTQQTGSSSSGGGGETFVHQRTKPTIYITMHGVALRVGYPIPMPELVRVNGKEPLLVGEPRFASGVVAEALFPVVGANWSMTYVFTDEGGIPTGSINPPGNPALA